MVWGKAGSDTLTSAGDTISVSFTTNKFINAFWHEFETGSALPQVRLNGSSSSVYAYRDSLNGGSDTTGTSTNVWNTALASLDTFCIMHIVNISGKEKLGIYHVMDNLTAGAGTAPRRQESVGKFVPSPDADITQIDVVNVDSGDFDTNSNLTVLGSDITPAAAIPFVANAQVGSRAEITDTRKMYNKESNGEYKIHTFTSSGTLAVTGSGDVEYLVVAGGGGGYCGGGGAGGMRTGTLSVSAGNKTVTVGAGGYSGQCNVNGHGDNGVGGNSVFDSITSTGGGFGGGAGGANNTEGGSSGGAGGNYTSNGGYPEDSVTPNQGNNGGKSDLSVSQKSGGGGGAGQVGGNASDGMLGGNGLASTISGSSVIYAGGGGGSFSSNNGGTSGAGGTGGGGGAGSAGTANTGGGGSGMNNSARAGYGGSGIVIVRYLTSSGITATGGTITTYNGWREIGT